MSNRRALLVGVFPPPVHGVSTVNAAVRDELTARGARSKVINLSCGSLLKPLGGRFARALRVVRSLCQLLLAERRPTTAYFGLSGGLGQLYDLTLVLAARVRRFRVIMHHNSFRYIDRRKLMTSLLVKAGGPDAHHVAVCEQMAHTLRNSYSAKAVLVISNAAFLPQRIAPGPRSSLRTVGFLSNMSEEKGILRYLEVMAELMKRNTSLRGMIAGQFQDELMRPQVLEAVAAEPRLKYVGACYDADKERFYEGVDMLLFPSMYADEADPLTVHEALRNGLPVICIDRGCLFNVIRDECGLVVGAGEPFVSIAAERILFWCGNPSSFQETSAGALRRARHFAPRAAAARQQLHALLTES